MIEPTLADIGRRVIYRSPGGDTVEQGTITSFNEQFVFVRYTAGPTSAATRREDLEFACGVLSDCQAQAQKKPEGFG